MKKSFFFAFALTSSTLCFFATLGCECQRADCAENRFSFEYDDSTGANLFLKKTFEIDSLKVFQVKKSDGTLILLPFLKSAASDRFSILIEETPIRLILKPSPTVVDTLDLTMNFVESKCCGTGFSLKKSIFRGDTTDLSRETHMLKLVH